MNKLYLLGQFKMNKLKFSVVSIAVLAFGAVGLLFPGSVYAGVGVSPATIENTRLFAGSTYTTQLVFSRSEATEQIFIELEPDLGKVNDWVEFLPGNTFKLEAGIQRTTITINVNVPEGETLDVLRGSLRLKVTTAGESDATVEVVKGAKIDVLLATTDSPYVDFNVRSVKLTDIDNQGIGKLIAKVENVGNVAAAPTKASFKILSLDEKELTKFDVSGFTDIAPGKTSDQSINFALRDLRAGEYFADITVYYQDKALREERVVLDLPVDTDRESNNVSVSNNSDFSRFLEENRLISLLLVVLIATAATALIIFLFRNTEDKQIKTTKKK